MIYYHNDHFTAQADTITVADRGFLLADGLFETLPSYRGQLFLFEQHWQRLTRGLEFLNIPCTKTAGDVVEVIQTLLQKNQLLEQSAAVRLTVTRGISEQRGLAPPKNPQPTWLITATPFARPTNPWRLCMAKNISQALPPLSHFKTLQYLDKIVAKQYALEQGYDDAILCNAFGQVVGASAANLFVVRGNELLTPALCSGTLPGVTAQHIVSLAERIQISIKKVGIVPEDLLSAEGLFLSNSLMGIQPISCFERLELDPEHALIQRLQAAFTASINTLTHPSTY